MTPPVPAQPPLETPAAPLAVHAVRYTYVDDEVRLAQLRPAHREFLGGLLADGVLLASGPWTAPEEVLDAPTGDSPAATGPVGAGPATTAATRDVEPGALLLVRADDAAHLQQVLDADPFAVAGLITERRVRRWNPVLGPWAG